MKGQIILAAIALCMVAVPGAAQRGGAMPGGHPATGPSGGRGAQPGLGQPSAAWSHGSGDPRFASIRLDSHEAGRPPYSPGPYHSPYFGYSDFGVEPQASAPAVVVLLVQPTSEPAPAPPPPPAPVRAHVEEYAWTPSGEETARSFAIVLKDGTVKAALSVCRQDGFLTLVATNGTGDQVEWSAVDRDATRRANAVDPVR